MSRMATANSQTHIRKTKFVAPFSSPTGRVWASLAPPRTTATASAIDSQYVARRSSSERRFQLQTDAVPQRVRFARPDILFYDPHRIDLHQSISGYISCREDKKQAMAHLLEPNPGVL
jgi:hypothetical protein